tara:strand:- start:1072 stop:1233 length:162 start_codon:yes stop_codon:yes gene_type:complete
MTILFLIAVAMITLFTLVTAWFMWDEGDILQGIVWSFLSSGLLIRWWEFIFNV